MRRRPRRHDLARELLDRLLERLCSGVSSRIMRLIRIQPRRHEGHEDDNGQSSSSCLRGLRVFVSLRRRRGQPLEDRPQACRGLRQVLRQHPHVADDGHEIGVAVPARHEMDMQVVDDARAGRTAEVDADVDARAAGTPRSSAISASASTASAPPVRRRSSPRGWRHAGSAPPSDGRCCTDRLRMTNDTRPRTRTRLVASGSGRRRRRCSRRGLAVPVT